MATLSPNERIEKACVDARNKLSDLGIAEQIQGELDWVLGSFRFDGNPVGLYELAQKALDTLKAYKEEKPRAISNKMIEEIEKAIAARA